MDERATIQRHSKSFALAARLLAPDARRRAERLYAWCRYADDAIDHAPTPLAATIALGQLRADLAAVYAGRQPAAPAAALLSSVVDECNLPCLYLEELLAGMGMDAAGTRYQTIVDLELYCHRVAGAVGLMMTHALGVSADEAGPSAGRLGIAMQLTNIARDVAEDWSRGRLYLPRDWLPGEPPAGRQLDDAAVAPAVERLLDVANGHYAAGEAGLRYLDRPSQLAIRVASRVYSAIGDRVRAAGCRPSAGRAVVPKWRKLLIVATATCRSLVPSANAAVRTPTTIWHYDKATGYIATPSVESSEPVLQSGRGV
jgi:phytoene synthase